MSKKSLISSYLASIVSIAIGLAFFAGKSISWIVLYFLLLAINLLTPLRSHQVISHHIKPIDPIDIIICTFCLLYGIFLLLFPGRFPSSLYLLYGLWMALTAFISAVNFIVIARDGMKGAIAKLFFTLYAGILSFFLIFGKIIHLKEELLAILAGIFFLIYGLQMFLMTLTSQYPGSWMAKHSHIALSVPLLAGAILPVSAYVSIHSLKEKSSEALPIPNDPESLHVYLYLGGTGFRMFGHIDIAYHGMIYSYGCHDPKGRTLFGTLGDGVLIQADETKFIKHAVNGEDRTIVAYGITLDESQKKILQERINNLMARTIPWQCAAVTDPKAQDYISRVWRNTGCQLYKFTKGKFRTYFVASTNCVLLADELIRSKQLRLVTPGGFITPGAYLSFLNDAYLRKEGNVSERKIYAKTNK
ncbi:MAG: hypothetical protein SOI44_03560 [Lactimicrobium sp.]|jgi:hypothetical protein|uniref:hypothetical protein n=1 Tax=Lactimicrobium sp. TaxID=2563780 RepID=UPI002F350B22